MFSVFLSITFTCHLKLAFYTIRWDEFCENLKNYEKQLGSINVQWSIYQDLYAQLSNWLVQMEKNVQQDRSLAWVTIQELRSKLFKEKVGFYLVHD